MNQRQLGRRQHAHAVTLLPPAEADPGLWGWWSSKPELWCWILGFCSKLPPACTRFFHVCPRRKMANLLGTQRKLFSVLQPKDWLHTQEFFMFSRNKMSIWRITEKLTVQGWWRWTGKHGSPLQQGYLKTKYLIIAGCFTVDYIKYCSSPTFIRPDDGLFDIEILLFVLVYYSRASYLFFPFGFRLSLQHYRNGSDFTACFQIQYYLSCDLVATGESVVLINGIVLY